MLWVITNDLCVNSLCLRHRDELLSKTACPRAGCHCVVYWPIDMEHVWYIYIVTCPCVIVERSRLTWLTWSRLLHVHGWCSEEARSGSYHGARSLDLCTITRTRDNRNVSNMFYIHCSINHTLTPCSGACCLTKYLSIPPKIKISPHSTSTYLKISEFFEIARARSTFRFV